MLFLFYYCDSVGYCIIVSVGLTAIYRRCCCWIKELQQQQHSSNYLIVIVIIIINVCSSCCFFSSLAAKTWTRNADWADRQTLFELVNNTHTCNIILYIYKSSRDFDHDVTNKQTRAHV